jgi:hypothetical protein
MIELTKEDFLSMRKDGLTFKEIGEFYNLTERQVNYRTKKWGFDFSKKKKVDELFFSSGTKAAYYWAGFIAADGYIEEDRNRLGIGLQLSDKEHLEKFKLAIKAEHDICNFMNNTACRIRFNSEQIVKDLKDIFNITGNKTHTYVLPNIPEEYLLLEFLRGYIDGDGHYDKKASGAVTVGLCASTKSFLISVKREFEKLLDRKIEQITYHQINKKGECYSLTLTVSDSKDIINLLFKNSTNNTRLTRKYNIASFILR